MAKFLVKTKENHDPKGKPRVYFACHADDFARYFEKICADLFRTHDCAVYYKENPSEWMTDEDKALDLKQFNLLVVPVTFSLLSTKNAVIDDEIPYARKERIPVLPIMLEPGLDELYSLPNKFGKAQYLDPYNQDPTAVSYAEKLKNYLEFVLVSPETAQRIRAAFDAYVFLSYRKKDRKHAQELIRLIHANPLCRDIAIWYDEFLTPGESFSDTIKKMLADSKMFALLVTPNLLEEPHGKPNFVMSQEYPYARDTGMSVLPVEMEDTDKSELTQKYKLLPPCVRADDEETFRERLMQTLSRVALAANDADPVHNYLIGLAYVEGIDVEVNRELGMELVTKAAEAELAEAMEYLRITYETNAKTDEDVNKAYYWGKQLAELYERTLGEDDIKTLRAKNKYAFLYAIVENRARALKICKRTHKLSCKKFGACHPDTIDFLHDVAVQYELMGNAESKALSAYREVYVKRFQSQGEAHPDTLKALGNYTWHLSNAGEKKKATELIERGYHVSCEAQGEDSELTIETLLIFAHLFYDSLSEEYTYSIEQNKFLTGFEVPERTQKAVELYERAYEWTCKTLGEEHPKTMSTLNDLAFAYKNARQNNQKALELYRIAYEQKCRVFGNNHPSTRTTLGNIGWSYSALQQWQKAITVFEELYNGYVETHGKLHALTKQALENLATIYGESGDEEKKQKLLSSYQLEYFREQSGVNLLLNEPDELFEKRIQADAASFGVDSSATENTVEDMIFFLLLAQDLEDALTIAHRAYDASRKVLGEKNDYTIKLLDLVAAVYRKKGDYANALKYYEQLYRVKCAAWGEDHEGTRQTANRIEETKQNLQKSGT